VAVTLQPATDGDTRTMYETVCQAGENICEAAVNAAEGAAVNAAGPVENVLNKGYHGNDVLVSLRQWGVRAYCSEPTRGRRNWKGKAEEKKAVYQNRRRIQCERGKRLLRQRGERVECCFAHLYETGGMRRTRLRRHGNILKRLLIHAAAFNPGLVVRKMGAGTPRGMRDVRELFSQRSGSSRSVC